MKINPTKRFSDRVQNYLKYRPDYPAEIISHLTQKIALTSAKVIADIGSGTGFLTKLFLQNGNLTYGVEPNMPMKQAAEQYLQIYPNFKSVYATAESTTLPAQSIDCIVVAQAFHWFDKAKAKQEFLRILKPNGYVVLIWNKRLRTSGFMADYEMFSAQYADRFEQTHRRKIKLEEFEALFGTPNYQEATFPNVQYFDFEGLKGRYLSSSYAFATTHPNHSKAMTALKALFETYQEQGKIAMTYQTNMYFHTIH